MTITGGSALPKDEIEKMMKEAEQFANEDQARRELAEARNLGDNLVYQTEKSLKEHGDKLSDDDKGAIESGIEDLKKALAGEDLEEIKSATDKLTEASHKLAEQIYAASQQEPSDSAGAAESNESSDDDVVDAEIVDDEGKS